MDSMFVCPAPQNTKVTHEHSNPQCNCIQRWGSISKVIEVPWGHMVSPPWIGAGPYKTHQRACALSACACTKERPFEDLERKPSASQKKDPYQKMNQWETSSWTSSLKECEKVNFCWVSHPDCGVLLRQPEQTLTGACFTFCISSHRLMDTWVASTFLVIAR